MTCLPSNSQRTLRALIWILCLCTAAGACGSSTAAQRPTITFSCAVTPDSKLIGHLHALYTQAFSQLGYNFVLRDRPGRRSLSDANEGITDGECARLGKLNDNPSYQNLVRVDALLVHFKLSAYSFRDDLPPITADNILNLKLRIGYPRGHAAQEALLAKLPRRYLSQFSEITHGIRMLTANRLDIMVVPEALLNAALDEIGSPAPHKVGVLAAYGAYPYLNSKHRHLAPPLAEVIKEILSDPHHPLHGFSESTQAN